MRNYRVRKAGPLRGTVRVPGDKSIGHRALIFAALAEGSSTIRGLSGGLDNLATAGAFCAMGVRIEFTGKDASVEGVGLDGLRAPVGDLDCGNSGTTMRMLAGVAAGQSFAARLVGDASLTRRPMRRIVEPLRARGASIEVAVGAKPGEAYPPLRICGPGAGVRLKGLEFEMPVASAQVKSALLLSGLYAEAATAIREPVLSRDHTERMMIALGVPLETAGPMVVLDPVGWERRWKGFSWDVPGDPSAAAFLLVAGQIVAQSRVHLDSVCTNPTRTGLLDALRLMGAGVTVQARGAAAGDEPLAMLTSEPALLRPGLIGGELVTRMIDEVPALCVLAAVTKGRTAIRDAAELRVKESDRIAAMDEVLTAFGVPVKVFDDGLSIEGGGALRAARVRSHGDHRIAMSAVLLGLAADGETIVEDVACVDTSFPGFAPLMCSLGASIDLEEA